MRALFIEAKSNVDVDKAVEKAIKLLPKKVGIVTTVQHKHKLKEIKNILEKNKIKAEIGGQVLGCDVSTARKIKDKVDAFLYVGSGRFHPIEVQLETGKKVVMANPLTNEAKQLEKQEVEKLKKQQKGALVKFLSSKEIGIIVSSKLGQERLKKALELKNKLKDKKCYIFLADTINPGEFENFPFIECWVNTACPRFADEKKGVLNYEVMEKTI
ncbi:2-(3-amino-3-carboxypropyl)histidine synthase subunit [Candidatus Woesearchaeota archaeon]|nr:2-(3-amino-3-carboxypropyl)histidine synthase subunit [Candidatus Woesearchaeota archaeon]